MTNPEDIKFKQRVLNGTIERDFARIYDKKEMFLFLLSLSIVLNLFLIGSNIRSQEKLKILEKKHIIKHERI